MSRSGSVAPEPGSKAEAIAPADAASPVPNTTDGRWAAELDREGKAVAKEFAAFLKDEYLVDPQKGELLRLIARKRLVILKRDEALQAGSSTTEEVYAAYYADAGRMEDEIHRLLGDAKYDRYKTAMQQVPIRRMVDVFASFAAAARMGITDAQKEQFVLVATDEYIKGSVNLFYDPRNPNQRVGNIVRDAMARQTADQLIAQRASEFLTPGQLAQLRIFQKDRVAAMVEGAASQPAQSHP